MSRRGAADPVELARQALTIDPGRSNILCFMGMKGRGKSSAARLVFDAWPDDRVVIDPTGNARPDDPATIALAAPFPSQLPDPPEGQPRATVWARVNPLSPTFEFDQEQAMSMSLHPRHRPKLIWRDEFGLGTSAQKMSNSDRALLMSSRHFEASALLVFQRPTFIPVLTLSQGDLFLIWTLPNPDDRERVAKNAGVPVRLFDRAYQDAQSLGPHAFLLFDRRNDVLLICPPLPNVNARGPRS